MQKKLQKLKTNLQEFNQLLNRNQILKIFGLRFLSLIVIGTIVLSFLRSNSELKYTIQHAHFVYEIYKIIMYASFSILKLIGFDAYIYYSETIYKYGVYAIGINGSRSIFMGISCIGMTLMGVFIALIVSFPGKIKHKLWYIPGGLIIIQFLNILRMCTLTTLVHFGFEHTFNEYNLLGIFKFNHHDLFNFFIYIIIFGMFVFYTNTFGLKIQDKKRYFEKINV
ncbi:MAG: exosortase/archaeosortase family protein [Bacteroidales bacterium]